MRRAPSTYIGFMSAKLELAGRQFGRLTVLRQAPPGKYARTYWICACTCGNEITAQGLKLTQGWTKSCGCIKRERAAETLRRWHRENPPEDITGKVFSRLTVLERAGSRPRPGGYQTTLWRARCECGGERVTTARSLRRGDAKSCGCLMAETLKAGRAHRHP